MRFILLFMLYLACFASQAQECTIAPTSAIDDTPEIQALRIEQQNLIEQIRQELAKEEENTKNGKGNVKNLLELRHLLVDMEEYIDREATTKHINRGTIFDPYCSYYQRFAQKLEINGADHFPKHNGQLIYGKVLVHVTINHDGSIESIHANEATSEFIEEHTIKLIKSLAPFEPIPDGAKEKYFELGVTFNYVHETERTINRPITPSDLSGKWQRGLTEKNRHIPVGTAFQRGLTAAVFSFDPDGTLLVELPCQEERFLKQIGGKFDIHGTWSLSMSGVLTTTMVFHGTTRTESGLATLQGREILVTPTSGRPWHLGKFIGDTQAKCTYVD